MHQYFFTITVCIYGELENSDATK